jgi:CRP-like cAMP-binding protein
MREGCVCNGVFLLCRGRVQLSLYAAGKRKSVEVRQVAGPAILGLPGIMLGQHFVASAGALTEVAAAFIPRTDLMEALHQSSLATLAFSAALSNELYSTYEHLTQLRKAHSDRALSSR